MDIKPHFSTANLNGVNRRRFFRLRLPVGSPLSLDVGGQVYRVLEVAEQSFVIARLDDEVFSGVCAGSLAWSDGSISDVQGDYGRVTPLGQVVWNVSGIEMPDVIGEQRRILARFSQVRESGLLG